MYQYICNILHTVKSRDVWGICLSAKVVSDWILPNISGSKVPSWRRSSAEEAITNHTTTRATTSHIINNTVNPTTNNIINNIINNITNNITNPTITRRWEVGITPQWFPLPPQPPRQEQR